jgi:FKBP-type peptidyl-prolyl cis-trans isomerase FkpA
MRYTLALCAAALVLACSPTAIDERWADPEKIGFAADLGIDLGAMTRTESGLYWQDLEIGMGLSAQTGHTAIVHFEGWLPDGRLFESTYQSDKPISFPIGGGLVIPGMDEGVIGMQLGGLRKLVIRPELAFGRTGKGPVPPMTTVIYEIRLVSIRL